MFDETTGRIRTSWKTVAGLSGAVLLAVLIGRLVSAEPTRPASAGVNAVASGPASRRVATAGHDELERLKAAARKSASSATAAAPASRPAMVEVRPSGQPAQPGQPNGGVIATPTPRPQVTATAVPVPARPVPRPVEVPSPHNVEPPPAAVPPVVETPEARGAVGAADREPGAPLTPASPPPGAAAPNVDPSGDPNATVSGSDADGSAAPAPSEPTAGPTAAHPAPAEKKPATGAVTSQVISADDRAEYLRKMYNFNLKGAEWKDVLEFFSRATGLSIVGETQDLTGQVDFFHQKPMTFKEAFSFLNRLLGGQAQPRIAILRKNYIQVIKAVGSTAFLRVLEPEQFYESYEDFKKIELSDDEKCVVFFSPTNADASDIVEQFRSFAPDTSMLIQPMGESNQVIVAGGAGDVDRWLQIVRRLVSDDQRPLKRFELKNAMANEVKNAIMQMFPAGSGARPVPQPGSAGNVPRAGGMGDKIDVIADDKNNILLVKATPRKIEEIGKLIEQLDVTPDDDATMVTYTLKHARAEELANAMRQMFATSGQPRVPGRSSGQWWRRGGGAAVQVQIVAEPGTNSLMVTADKEAQAEIKILITKFDVADQAGTILRVPLQQARAETVAEVLRQAFMAQMRPSGPKGPPLTITPDPVNNVVVAAGEPQLLSKVGEAIKQLDAASSNQATEHVVALKQARPSEVSNALTGVFQSPGRPNNSVRFLPIETAGTVVVVAPPSDWERIEPIIKLLDKQAEETSPQMKSYKLAHADANNVASILNQAVAANAQRRPGIAVARVFGDPRTNSVLVQADAQSFDDIEQLIAKLDTEDADGATVVITLETADAAQTAQILQQSMQGKPAAGGLPVQVVAEPLTNSVIIRNATKADLAQLRDLIAKMDTAAGSLIARTFRPKSIDAAELMNAINGRFATGPGKVPGSGNVRVVASAGAVSVEAPAEVMVKIEKMVVELDVPGQFSGPPLIMQVQNADPNQLVAALNVMYSRGPKGPLAQFAANGQNIVVQAPEMLRADITEAIKLLDVAGGGVEVKTYKLNLADATVMEGVLKSMLIAGARPGAPVQVSSDARINSLIVAAPHATHAMAEQLLSEIDKAPADDSNITQIVPLGTTPAADAAKILQESIASKGPGAQAGGALTRVRVSSSAAGNALILTGPRNDVARAMALVQDIEKVATESASTMRSYTLKNSDAADVAKTLDKMFPAAAGKEGLKASADTRTNTLFLAGPASKFGEVEKVLKIVDTEEVGAGPNETDIQMVRVRKGDPDDIADRAQKLLDAKYGKQSPLIESDLSSGTLYITGKKDQFAKAIEVIQMLEKDAPPIKQKIAVRRIKVPSDQLVKALQDYAPQYLRGTVKIEQATSPRDSVKPEDLIRELHPVGHSSPAQGHSAAPASQPTSGRTGKKSGAPVSMVPAVQALQAILLGQTAANASMSVASPGSTPAASAEVDDGASDVEEPGIVVKIDPETQQLVIVGTSVQVDQIDELLKMIEEAYSGDKEEIFSIRMFQLQEINATSAAQVLEQMFNDAPVAAPQPPPQPGQPPQPQPGQPPPQPGQPPSPQHDRGDAANGRSPRGGQPQPSQAQQARPQAGGGRQRIRAIADLRVNAVLVRAAPQDMPEVMRVLSVIDRKSEIKQDIRIIPLKNLKASEVERIIKDLLRIGGGKNAAAPQGVPGQAVSELRQAILEMDLGGEGGVNASLSSADVVTITSEDISNTLYVSGPAGFLDLIESFVAKVDSQKSVAMVIQTIALKHADVEDVVAALQDVIGAGKSGGKPSAEGAKGGAMPGDIGPVSMAADYRTNSLVIRCRTDDLKTIMGLIETMDGESLTAPREIQVINADPEALATKLAQVFVGEQGKGKTRSKIQIVGDLASKKLLVSATDEIFKQIQQAAQSMDVAGGDLTVKAYVLRNAVATEVAEKFQIVITQLMAQAGKGGTKLGPISLVPDVRTNSVLVTASPSMMSQVDAMILALDKATTDPSMAPRIFALKKVRAGNVVKMLQAAFGQAGGKGSTPAPAITADEAGNAVVVRACTADMGLIEKFIIDFDDRGADSDGGLSVIPLTTNSDPTMLAQTVERVVNSAAQNAAKLNGGMAGQITVGIDDRTGSLIVAGSPAQCTEARELVERLEKIRPSGPSSMKIIKVSRDSAEVQKMLDQVFGKKSSSGQGGRGRGQGSSPSPAAQPQPSAAPAPQPPPQQFQRRRGGPGGGTPAQPAANRSGDASDDALRQQQQEIKEGVPAEGVACVRPALLAPLLLTAILFGQSAAAPAQANQPDAVEPPVVVLAQATQPSSDVDAEPPIEVQAQPVPAVPEAQPAPPASPAGRGLRVFSVPARPDAGPSTPAESPDAEASPQGPTSPGTEPADNETRAIRNAPDTGPVAPPEPAQALEPGRLEQLRGNIQYTPLGSGEIAIQGSDEDIRVLEELIRQIDQGTPPPVTAVFQLKNAQADKIAPQLTALFQQISQVPGRTARSEDKVTIVADARSNSLIVAAAPERMLQVQDLIEKLDTKPMIGQVEIKTYLLKHILASEAQDVLQKLLQKLQQARGVTGDPITIQADDRTNALLITAPTAELPQIENLISAVDVPPAFASAEMMIYSLHNVPADKMVTVLNDMISAQVSHGGAPAAGAARPAGGGGGGETIRRLKLRTADGKELPELNLEKPIKLIAEPNTNSLIVSSTPDNLRAMSDIIKLLDTYAMAEGVRVWIFPLQYADATELATMLKTTFQEGRNVGLRSAQQGTSPATPVPPGIPQSPAGEALNFNALVMADARTNTLLVAGREQSLALAEQIIGKIDKPGQLAKWPIHVVPMKNTDATKLAQVVQTMLNDRMAAANIKTGKVLVAAEPRTNALIISSPEDRFEEINKLVTQLDTMPTAMAGTTRIVVLDNNDAPAVAQALNTFFQQRSAGGQQTGAAEKVVVIADIATNALLISASEENFKVLMDMVQRLDTVVPVEALVRTFTLQNADANTVAETLKNLFSQGVFKQGGIGGPPADKAAKLTVTTDPRSNTLIISAKQEWWPLIENLVRRMDSPEAPFTMAGAFTIIPLEHSDAVRMASVLQDLLDRMEKAEQAGGRKTAIPQPVIIPDPRTNSLLISATPQGVQRVQSLVTRLDQPTGLPTAEIRVYPLKEASADHLEQVISDLFQRRGQGGGAAAPAAGGTGGARAATPMTVYADSASNSLVVSASREDHQLVANLLDLLDVPNQAAQQVRIFPLEKAQAGTVVQVLQSLFQMRSTGGAGGGASTGATGAGGVRSGSVGGITFTADDRSNSVVVRAAPADMRNVEDLIRQLDTSETQVEMGMRWVQLKRADATDMAKLLNDFLQTGATSGGGYGGGGGSSSNAASQSFLINFKETNPQGEQIIQRLLRQNIRITADTRTNTLIVMAPQDSVDVLVQLIGQLDGISPVTAEIEVLQLQNADATEVVDLLEKLFGVGKGAQGTGTGRTAEEQRNLMIAQQSGFGGGYVPGGVGAGGLQGGLGAGGLPGGVAPGGLGAGGLQGGFGAGGFGGGLGAMGASGPMVAGGRPILAFTVDTRTNSVIAQGAPDYLALVRQLIDQLDSQEMASRLNRVYAVKYTDAASLETALKSYFQAETQRMAELKTDIPAQRRMDQEVNVVAEKDANKLLISVSPRMESQVMEMLRELDQQPPQVMIQVLMAEVTLDNRLEWGFEFAAQDLYFTRTGKDFDTVGGTSMGAAGTGSGFTFTLTGEDLSMLLRTLETESRAQVLSRPQIMVLDNQKAKIQVGENVPYVSNVTINQLGQTQTVVGRQDVGIILDVTPHITPDDFVRMEVKPEISALSDSTVQISENLRAPVFTKRTAETTITVKNGETVVIGGLIRNAKTNAETKVPVLGDIPILGLFFKSATNTNSKTELLIVMTPRIIRTIEDEHQISVQERDIGGNIPYDSKRSPLWQGLQVVTPPVPSAPQQIGVEERAPATQRATYGPAPVMYGPRPPSASIESAAPSDAPISVDRRMPGAGAPQSYADRLDYLELRR